MGNGEWGMGNGNGEWGMLVMRGKALGVSVPVPVCFVYVCFLLSPPTIDKLGTPPYNQRSAPHGAHVFRLWYVFIEISLACDIRDWGHCIHQRDDCRHDVKGTVTAHIQPYTSPHGLQSSHTDCRAGQLYLAEPSLYHYAKDAVLSTALSVLLLLLPIATTTTTGGWRTTEGLLGSSVVVAAIVEVAVAAGATATVCISTRNMEGYEKPQQYQQTKPMTPHTRSRLVAALMIRRPLIASLSVLTTKSELVGRSGGERRGRR